MKRDNKVMIRFLSPFVILGMLGVFMLSYGCASNSFVENGYDTLATVNNSVDSLMTELGKKYRKGEVTESQKERISEVYVKLRAASDAADTALAMYAASQTEEAKEKFENKYSLAMDKLIENREVFVNLARKFLEIDYEQ